MLEIQTLDGNVYLVMGERVLLNGQRMMHHNCPTLKWVGSCERDGSGAERTLVGGRHLCLRFRSGVHVADRIWRVRDKC